MLVTDTALLRFCMVKR